MIRYPNPAAGLSPNARNNGLLLRKSPWDPALAYRALTDLTADDSFTPRSGANVGGSAQPHEPPVHLVLDLDDTLYLERDFVRSGFRAVEQETGIDGLSQTAWRVFEQGGRGDIFDQALARLGASADVDRLVEIYRAHRPAIRLAVDAQALLDRWDAPLGLISDGPASTQESKLEALGIADRFRSKILTGRWGPEFYKPHPRSFVETERRLGPGAYVYVADNPTKDFEAPKKLGWRTIRIQREKGLYAQVQGLEADFVVRTLDGIERILG